MSTQQAYINGFVKRAAEYGYSRQQAATILKQASVQGVLDSMKKGFGNLKSRVMGGYQAPSGPTQSPASEGYDGPAQLPDSIGYDYPIGPTQPDNFRGEMSGGGPHISSNKSINMGTNLVGNQPRMSPPAALMKGIAGNSSVQAGLQGAKKTWNEMGGIQDTPGLTALTGLLAAGSGAFDAGQDVMNKAVNSDPRIAPGLQGYSDAAQSVFDRWGEPEWSTGATGTIGGGIRVGGNLLKGLASIPVGAKGAYNAVQNYNQANPRQ